MGVYQESYNRIKNNIERQCTSTGDLSEFTKMVDGTETPNIVYGVKTFRSDGLDNRIYIDLLAGSEGWETTHQRRGAIEVFVGFEIGYSSTDLSDDYIGKNGGYLDVLERLLDSAFKDQTGQILLPLDSDDSGTETVRMLEPEARGQNFIRGGFNILIGNAFFLETNRRQA